MPHIKVFELPRTRQRPPFAVSQAASFSGGIPFETAAVPNAPLVGGRGHRASGEAR